MKLLKLIIFNLVLVFMVSSIFAQGGMIVHPGTNVSIPSGIYIDLGSGNLLLQDDYSNAPSFLEQGNLTYSGGGEAVVEQYLVKDQWHLVSSPVSNEVNGAYLWIYLYEWDEPSDAFTPLYQPLNIPLNVGEGYYAYSYTVDPNGLWPASPDFVILNGTTNKSDVNINLDYTSGNSSAGFNFLGNPFPVAIDWNGHADWNLGTNTSATMWIWDGSNGNYMSWNWNTGLGTGGKTNGIIPATQAFWVQATASGESLTIPEAQRLHSSEAFYKDGSQWDNLLRLTLSNATHSDETLICFFDEATAGNDLLFDARYMPNDMEVPSLSSKIADVQYAMNFLPDYKTYSVVPLNTVFPENGEYSINVSGVESFDGGIPVLLEDKGNGVFYDLRKNNDYRFTANINDNPDRFAVHFAQPGDISIDDLLIYSYQTTVKVQYPYDADGMVEIFDLAGRIVLKANVQQGSNEYHLPAFGGVLTVRVINDEVVKTEKIFIK